MKTLSEQLIQYAHYHRDPRNIATHFVGIPMIVVAVSILLARVDLGPLSLAHLVALGLALFYLRLDGRYGLVMAAALGLSLMAAQSVAAWPLAHWAATGVGLFVVGWVFQLAGHAWEGRKPAFVDDLVGLAIGPLFVVAEAGFLLGLRREVQAQVNAAAGPVRRREALAAAPGAGR